MTYNKKDHYYHLAKEEGYLARSAYKLQEIQKKFRVLKRGGKILDLGCAPGAWSQVALETIQNEGFLVGIDLEPVELQAKNAKFITRDAFALKEKDLEDAPFDCILSDMAPKTSGIKIRDQARSAELCQKALEVSQKFLKPGGHLVMKLFEGEDAIALEKEIAKYFEELKRFRPQSTRKASIEVYLIALRKKA